MVVAVAVAEVDGVGVSGLLSVEGGDVDCADLTEVIAVGVDFLAVVLGVRLGGQARDFGGILICPRSRWWWWSGPQLC